MRTFLSGSFLCSYIYYHHCHSMPCLFLTEIAQIITCIQLKFNVRKIYGHGESCIFQKEVEKVPTVPLSKIMKMNSTEWPYILLGAVCSAIQGTIMPLYAIMFGEVLGVRAWAGMTHINLCV